MAGAFKQLWLDASDVDLLQSVLSQTKETIEEARPNLETLEDKIAVEAFEKRVDRMQQYLTNVLS